MFDSDGGILSSLWNSRFIVHRVNSYKSYSAYVIAMFVWLCLIWVLKLVGNVHILSSCKFITVQKKLLLTQQHTLHRSMRRSRGGGTGGPPAPPPPTHTHTENNKNIGFLGNNGLDPLKITKLPSQHSMLGHHPHSSKTPFKWRFAGRQMMS